MRGAAGAATACCSTTLTRTELRDAIAAAQDDDHRPDRRHRAERPAHDTREAQRARPRARRADRRRRSATRWSRRSSPMCPKAASIRRPRTCASRERSRAHDRAFEGGARNVPRAASGGMAFATSCSSATSGGYQKDEQARAATRLNREWANAPAACLRSIDYYRVGVETALRRAVESARLYQRRRDRYCTRDSPTRRLRLPLIPVSCARICR